MKTELSSAILAAVAGVVISFLVCNLLVGDIDPTDVPIVSGEVGADYDEPNPEIFNYKALNPTVEVFVGNGENGTTEYTYQAAEEVEELIDDAEEDNNNDNNNDNDANNNNTNTKNTNNSNTDNNNDRNNSGNDNNARRNS